MMRSIRTVTWLVVTTVGVAGPSARAVSGQLPKPPVISVTVPVDFHHLPHEVTSGGISCSVWHGSDTVLAFGGVTFRDVRGGADLTHEFHIPLVFEHAGVSLDGAHWVCAVGFAASISGTSYSFAHYDTGPNLMTDPYAYGTHYQIAPARGSAPCITVGGPMLPQPIRGLTCYDSATDGTCPCGCGNTGRCTSSAPGFTAPILPAAPRGQPLTSPGKSVPRPTNPASATAYTPPQGAHAVPGLTLTGTGALTTIRR
jgi:hypothetical protein